MKHLAANKGLQSNYICGIQFGFHFQLHFKVIALSPSALSSSLRLLNVAWAMGSAMQYERI